MAIVTLMPSEDSGITFICAVRWLGRDTLVGALNVQTLLSSGAGMELPVQALIHICGKGGQVR